MNLSEIIMGIGSLLAGAKALSDGFENAREAVKPLRSRRPGEKRQLGQLRTETHEVQNIRQRLGYILKQIKKGTDDPYVRRAAVLAVSRKCDVRGNPTNGVGQWCTPEKNPIAELDAVYNWVRDNVRYVRDTTGKDLFQHPRRTLEFGGGDCDDYAILISSLLRSIGYDHIRLVVIRTHDASDWNHIYLRVGVPPRGGPNMKWVAMDASVDKKAGWDPAKAMRDQIAALKEFRVP